MNTIDAQDVLLHPLIKEIIRRRLAKTSLVRKLIIEELMYEASTPKGNLGAKIRNVINRSLGKGMEPPEVAKLISDPGSQYYKGWLASIQKVQGEEAQQDLKLYMDNFIKNAVGKLQSGEFKMSPVEQKNLDALKQKLAQTEDPKEQYALVTQATEAGLVTQQQAQELVQDIETEQPTDQQDDPEQEEPSGNEHGVNVEEIKKKYAKLFNGIDKVLGDLYGEEHSNGILTKEFAERVLAYFLHSLDQVLSTLSEGGNWINDGYTDTPFDKKQFRDAVVFAQKAPAKGEPQESTTVLSPLFNNGMWTALFKQIMNGKVSGADAAPEDDADATPGDGEVVTGTDDPEGGDVPPVDGDPEVTDDEETEMVATPTPEQREEVQEEVREQVEEATSDETMSEVFSDDSPQATIEQYDEAIMNGLDHFFGQKSDQSSFMKQIALYQQSDMLYGNLVPNLNTIIKGPKEGSGGVERKAYTDEPGRKETDDEAGKRTSPDSGSDSDDSGSMEETIDLLNEDFLSLVAKTINTIKAAEREGEKRKVRKEREKLEKLSQKMNKARHKEMKDENPKLYAKTMAQMDQDFPDLGGPTNYYGKQDDEADAPKSDKPIPIDKKTKVALKRQLAALADILVEAKYVAKEYEEYATRTSVDPRYDGSKLKEHLNNILGHIQEENRRLVLILRQWVEQYAQETADMEKLNEEESDERNQKVKITREAFNNMGQLYVRSLKTSLQENDQEDAIIAAKEMLEIAKTIIPYFPKGMVHGTTGEVVSVKDAATALIAQVKSYKKVLRDIYETVKDDAIAPAHVRQMLERIKIICKTIDDNFDVPCKISEKDTKVLDQILPQSERGLDDEEEEIETGSGEPEGPDDDEEEEIETGSGEPEDVPGQPQLMDRGPEEEEPEQGQLTDRGSEPEQGQLTGPSGDEPSPEYSVSEKFDLGPYKQAWQDVNADSGGSFEDDLSAWVNFMGPFIPKGQLSEAESAKKRDNPMWGITKISDHNFFMKNKEKIIQKFKELQQSDPKKAKKVFRVSRLVAKKPGKGKGEYSKTFARLLRNVVHTSPEKKSEKEIEEALIRKLVPIIRPMLRGYNG